MYDVLDISRFIINYSNKKKYGVSNLKLQKLLYFIQAYFLVEKHEPCFKEPIEAWDFGPVVPVAYNYFAGFGGCNIYIRDWYLDFGESSRWDNFVVYYDETIIKKRDREIISEMIDHMANYSATDLVKITHNQSPWRDTFRPYMNLEISHKVILNYFSK